MSMQKLFAMRGQYRGAAKAEPAGRGSALCVKLCPAARDARLFAASVSGALHGGAALAATGAVLPDVPPGDIGAVFVVEEGRIVSSGINGVTSPQLEAAALKLRLALAEETARTARAKLCQDPTKAAAPHEGPEAPRACARPAPAEPEPKSRAAAAIVTHANSLFSPEDSDYDTAAFLAREPFRPRPAAPVPCAPEKPCAAPAPTPSARRCSGRRRYRR